MQDGSKGDAHLYAQGIEAAPTFHPTEQEFKDPLAYINSCRPAGERSGIVCIVPPLSFKPPFALEKVRAPSLLFWVLFTVRPRLLKGHSSRPDCIVQKSCLCRPCDHRMIDRCLAWRRVQMGSQQTPSASPSASS